MSDDDKFLAGLPAMADEINRFAEWLGEQSITFDITPAMAKAGADVIEEWGPYYSADTLAEKVFAAMIAAREP